MTEARAKKLTRRIIKIILIENNGYSEEECDDEMIDSHQSHELWEAIQSYLEEN